MSACGLFEGTHNVMSKTSIIENSLSPGTPEPPRHGSNHKAPLPHPPDPTRPSPESCSRAVLQQRADRRRTVDEASGSERARRARRACRLARTLPDGSSTFLRCPPSGGAWPLVLKPWGWAVGLPQLLERAYICLITHPHPGVTGRRGKSPKYFICHGNSWCGMGGF